MYQFALNRNHHFSGNHRKFKWSRRRFLPEAGAAKTERLRITVFCQGCFVTVDVLGKMICCARMFCVKVVLCQGRFVVKDV